MEDAVVIDTRAVFQKVLSGIGCRHEWSKGGHPQERRNVCSKCGLHAYIYIEPNPKLAGPIVISDALGMIGSRARTLDRERPLDVRGQHDE
jgi:hypothetical protein